ncbi:MAG: hypothetical protein QM234_08520 [Acidobacteriota bacterium]|jgi:hypothetical protein|nr:hypothetical protein [Verrucomicrobiota bacterium]MDI9588977.1 hypothetical protein [Acidobacteriota bacterium]
MKKKLTIAVALVAVFAFGGLFGAAVQHLRGGYWHKVLKTESFPFPNGEVTLSYTAESIGMPFLDPETSVLTVKTKYGLPITVYKAKRMFQESCPHVRDVKTESNQVTWKDGINTYRLIVEPMNEQAEQGAAPLPSAPRPGPSEGAR